MTYKALATKQPWASLIALGKKTIEVRTWKTHYRGSLVIIASSKPNSDFAREYPAIEQPTSCLMVLVDLVDVRPGRKADRAAALCDPTGAYSWVLANPRPLVRTPYTRSRVMTFDLEPNVRVQELATRSPCAARASCASDPHSPPSVRRPPARRTVARPADAALQSNLQPSMAIASCEPEQS